MATICESLLDILADVCVKEIFGITGDALNSLVDAIRRVSTHVWFLQSWVARGWAASRSRFRAHQSEPALLMEVGVGNALKFINLEGFSPR